jgi:hypothetical protein
LRQSLAHPPLGTTGGQIVNSLCKSQGKAVHAGAGVQSPNRFPTCREAGDTLYTASCASFSCLPQDVVVLIPPRAALAPLASSLSGAILNTRSATSGSLVWVRTPHEGVEVHTNIRCRLFRRRGRRAGPAGLRVGGGSPASRVLEGRQRVWCSYGCADERAALGVGLVRAECTKFSGRSVETFTSQRFGRWQFLEEEEPCRKCRERSGRRARR